MSDTYLVHYGTLGMHWGVRKYQNPDGSHTPAGHARYDDAYGKEGKGVPGADSSKKNNNSKSKNSTDVNSNTKKGLTDKQKRALKIGAVAAGVGLAAIGGYALYSKYGKNNGKVKGATLKPTLDMSNVTDASDAESLKQVNAGMLKLGPFGNIQMIKGSNMNCCLCTTAKDLRDRGFDVHAGQSTTGFTEAEVTKFWKNTTDKDWYTPDFKSIGTGSKKEQITALENQILKDFPEGSRGNMFITYNQLGVDVGRHSVQFVVKNGKVQINDGQVATVSDLQKALKNVRLSEGSLLSPAGVKLLRTDDKEPDIDYLINNGLIRTNKNSDFLKEHAPEVAFRVATSPQGATTAALAAIGGYKVKQYVNENKQNDEEEENGRKASSKDSKRQV